MTVLVDSNVFLDIYQTDSGWLQWSTRRLIEARATGELIYNVVIASEVAFSFKDLDQFSAFRRDVPAKMEGIPDEAAFFAAQAHKSYRKQGGKRDRTLPDFLIGAHALVNDYRILTRDPTGYRTYFPQVPLVTPETHP